jgi:hypothetical protein
MAPEPWLRGASCLVLGLGVILSGCRARHEGGDAGSVAQPEPVVAKEQALVPPPGCEEVGKVLLSVEPAHVSLVCEDGFERCSGRATLTVRSCAARAFEFHEVWLRPAPPVSSPVIHSDDVRLEPGQVWTTEIVLEHVGTYELELDPLVRSPGEPALTVGTAALIVENPARDRAMEDCRACNGYWGPQGMMQREGCNCRTRDGGTPCDDADDCEAQCVAREPEDGFTCSAFAHLYGCYSYLPEGWSKQRRRKNVVPPAVCAD